MLRRFLKQSFTVKSSLGSSLASSTHSQSKSYKSISIYKSLSPVHSYNFSYLSLTSNTLLRDPIVTAEQIKSFKENVASISIEESLNLMTNACVSQSPNHNTDLLEIYKAVEGKFNNGASHYAKADVVVSLSNFFAVYGLGGKKFWENLSDRFGSLLESNVYSLDQIALFTYNVTKFKVPTEDFWEIIENKIVAQGPASISGDSVALLLSAYVRYHSIAFSPTQKSFNSSQQEEASSIENKNLWIVLKKLAMKKVPNLSSSSLLNVAQTLSNNVKEDGFWLDVEDRFNEIVYKLPAREVSQFALSMSEAKKGTSNLWTDFEKYFSGSVKILDDEEVSNFIAAFANSDQGTIKFWDAAQNHTLNNLNKYTAASLSQAALGFALAEINKNRLWDALQEKAIDLMAKFSSTDLTQLIQGFSISKRGDERFWSALEERVLHLEENHFIVRYLVYSELIKANKVTPKLAHYFKDVQEFANYYEQKTENVESKQKDEKSQARSL
jgi:hypothetical protein